MKTYNMHVTMDNEEFHVTTHSSEDRWHHGFRVFSAVCSDILYGFGDAKANLLYDLMMRLKSNTSDSMSYTYQGHKIHIKVEVC